MPTPALQRLAAADPDYLPVGDLRLHAVAGDAHGEVCLRRRGGGVHGLEVVAVEELTGAG